MDPESSSSNAAAQSVRRALNVLNLFVETDEQSLGVTEIANQLGLAKAVVHRTLSAFRSTGLLLLDDTTRRYSLGPQVLALGEAYLRHLDARALIRDAMVDLMTRTKETVTLSIRVGWSRVYIDQVTPDRDVKMLVNVGRSYPLHAGASSKAVLAFIPESECNEYLRSHRLSKLTPHTTTSVTALRSELAKIRNAGFSSSLGERDESAGSVAAPLFNRDGTLLGVMSVCGPKERFAADADTAADALLKTVSHLHHLLGSTGQAASDLRQQASDKPLTRTYSHGPVDAVLQKSASLEPTPSP